MYIYVYEMYLCSFDFLLNVRVYFFLIELLYFYFFIKFIYKLLIV